METGMGLKNLNFFIGVVEDNNDPRKEGRVKVRAFGIHGTNTQIQTSDLPWATMIVPNINFVPPPLNAWVFGFFIDGRDSQQPMIMGIIPTQMTRNVDPNRNGYGSIATENHLLLAKGSRPQDFGEPMLSRNARGENVHMSHPLAMEVTKVSDIKMAGSEETWSEPGSAYHAEYPFNHVYETASGHSIEVDDTPGAERILVFHKNGSYIQIDSAGTTTHKSTGDKYDINEANHHVYIGNNGGGAKSTVTIMGDSVVYVDGNKTEEIRGDYRQIIHGNHEVSVGGQMNLNASDEAQLRGAKLTLESNVEHFSIRAGKEIKLTSGVGLHLKSESIFIESNGSTSIKGGADLKLQGSNVSMKGSAMFLDSSGALNIKGSSGSIGMSGNLGISGSTVYLDDVIRMAEGGSSKPSGAPDAESASEAVTVDLEEPAFKSPNTGGGSTGASGGSSGSMGTAGYSSQDDGGDSTYNASYDSSMSGDNMGSSESIPDSGSVQKINNPVAVRELYKYLIEEGLSKEQAIGALVNIQRESAFNAAAVQPGNLAVGLFQFDRSAGNAAPFEAAVPDWRTNPRGQINYMFKTFPDGKNFLRKSFSSNLAAANDFTMKVERPRDKDKYTAPGGYNERNLPGIEAAVGSEQTVVDNSGGINTPI